MEERGGSSIREQGSGVEIHHGAQNNFGLCVCPSLKRTNARETLEHLIVTRLIFHRPCLAVASERAIDQARIHCFQALVIDTETGWHGWAKVMNQHVRRRYQTHKCGEPFFVLQIESESALA